MQPPPTCATCRIGRTSTRSMERSSSSISGSRACDGKDPGAARHSKRPLSFAVGCGAQLLFQPASDERSGTVQSNESAEPIHERVAQREKSRPFDTSTPAPVDARASPPHLPLRTASTLRLAWSRCSLLPELGLARLVLPERFGTQRSTGPVRADVQKRVAAPAAKRPLECLRRRRVRYQQLAITDADNYRIWSPADMCRFGIFQSSIRCLCCMLNGPVDSNSS
jgi:hypothetical protein